jgi:hypothetical protein
MIGMVNSARDGIVVDRSAAPFEPREQARPHIWSYFELNRTSGLLLNDPRSGSDFGSCDERSNLHLREVAAAQLAVDCKRSNNARSLMRSSRSRKKRIAQI